jgi:hypothetical protein
MEIHKLEGFECCWYGSYPAGAGESNQFFVRLNEKDLLVISPGTNLVPPALPDQLTPNGNLFLVAPNIFHHMGIARWKRFFGGARCFGHGSFLEKFQEKGQCLEPVSQLTPLLPDHVQVFKLPSTRNGELLVMVEEHGKRLWITGDSFFNIQRLPSKLLVRAFLKICGAAPGLRISRLFKHIFVLKRGEYKKWMLEHLIKFPPNCLLVCHGSPLVEKSTGQSVKDRLFDLVQDTY